MAYAFSVGLLVFIGICILCGVVLIIISKIQDAKRFVNDIKMSKTMTPEERNAFWAEKNAEYQRRREEEAPREAGTAQCGNCVNFRKCHYKVREQNIGMCPNWRPFS